MSTESDLDHKAALNRIEVNFRQQGDVLDLSDLIYLTEIPPEIGKLTHLKIFEVGHYAFKKGISDLPKEFYNLANLTKLSFRNTNITELDLKNLIHLTYLDLNNTKITELDLKNNVNLTKLIVHKTNIAKLDLKNLQHLTELDVSQTKITELDLKNLPLLTKLIAFGTKITELDLKNNVNLTELDVFNTNINELNLDNLSKLTYLDLRNTEIDLPDDVLEQTRNPQYIIKYYRENVKAKKAQDLSPLNEVKMLLVGQGRVGKTSLVKYLIHNTPRDPNEPTTHGILREKWKVDVVNQADNAKHNIQLNVWDFGGQDIMKSTHQFFLTDKSLYLLVLDAGRDKEGNKLFYWLEKIKSVGNDSPIIIVVNKSEENTLLLPETDLKTNYNVKAIFNVSCVDGKEIVGLRKSIKDEIGNMKSVFEKIRNEWFAVKEHLENLKEDFISKDKYREICKSLNVTERDSQDVLLKRLNDLGIMLNFERFETKVLNPEWVTRGVYKVVTSAEVQKNKGILTPNLLKDELEILNDELRKENKEYLCYPSDKYNFITDLMKQFELTYQITDSENFLIPALLPEDYTLDEDWNEKECLRFRYDYKDVLLDEGIISKFIVKTQNLSHNQKHWLTGCLLKNDKKNLALIKANIQKGFVDIWIKGNTATRREFLGILKEYFDSIHKDKKPTELIPFFDYENEFLNYQDLIAFEISGDFEDRKVINGELIKYDIRQLLNGYSTPKERFKEYYDDKFDELRSRKIPAENENKIQKKQNEKEINDIVEPYSGEDNNLKVEPANPTLFKTLAAFVLTFIAILATIIFCDYLKKQGYISEEGFYIALTFTVVFIVIIAVFSLVYLKIIPPNLIPDILKPVFGLITDNKENKELNPKSINEIEKKENEKQLNQ